MTLKLRRPLSEPDARPDLKLGLVQSTTTISGWLAMLSRMLPRGQAESIREELKTHLTDRVRDLMVGGLDENQATQRAIAELGEAADMAAKYRALQTEPRRRFMMYGSIFTVCGAALALSIAAISGGRLPAQPVRVTPAIVANSEQQPGNVRLQYNLELSFEPRQVPPEFDALKFDIDFKNTRASDALEFVAQIAKMPLQVHWENIKQFNIDKDTQITLKAKQAGAAMVLQAINEAANRGKLEDANKVNSPIGWRVNNGVIEVASAELFDRREVKLTIYDLSAIVRTRIATYHEERGPIVEEVSRLITEFVSPEGWRDNGGDLARMTRVGDRLFIEAPDRYHAQIKWILGQLPAGGGAEGGEGADKPRGQISPLPVRVYALKNTIAAELVKMLGSVIRLNGLEGQSIMADPAANTVIVAGGEARQKEISEIIAMLDVAAGNRQEHPKKEAMQSFPLRVIDAQSTSNLLTQVFNVAPGLKQCEVERAMTVNSNTNSLVLKATQDQIDVVAKLIDIIDRPAPAQIKGSEASRQFMLKHISPTDLRELLSVMFNESPALKQCAVGRSMECNDNTGFFNLTATKDQVDVVAGLIALMDRPAFGR